MLRLLVPVNGSEHALDAVRHAAHLFLDQCVSDIVLLNVQGALSRSRAAAFHPASALREIERKDAEAALQKARAILDDAAANYVTQIEVGPVARTIAQCAAANQCDAIVMGTAGRSLIGTLIAGRLSNRLIRLSAVPVTLVK